VRDLGIDDVALDDLLGVEQHFGDAEQAHHHGDEADAVDQFQPAESQARLRGDAVEPDHAEHDADAGHQQRLRHRALRQEGQERRGRAPSG
jgi:hypothetical protein